MRTHVIQTFLLSGLLWLGGTASAQLVPTWEAAPGGTIQWVRSTSAGNLISCTGEGLKGIDAVTGKVLWTLPGLANAPEAKFQEVKGTPFVALSNADGTDPVVVVDPFTGRVLFSAADAGLGTVASNYFIYAAGVIVVVGKKTDGTPHMVCVDMATGKPRWTKEGDFSRLTGCAAAGKDHLLVSSLFFCYKLDAATGDEVWKTTPDPKFASMGALFSLLDKGGANLDIGEDEILAVLITPEQAPGIAIMAAQSRSESEKTDSKGVKTTVVTYNTFVNGFDIRTGEYAWEKPVQMQNKLGAVIPLKKGLMIGAGDKSSVDLVDYRTGAGLWGKKGNGINVKGGPLNGAVEMGDRYLLTSGGSKAVAMLYDAMGEEAWPKHAKMSGSVRSVKVLPQAIMIGSDEEVDILDKGTGESLIGGEIKGGAQLTAMGDDALYVYNAKDGLLHRMEREGRSLTAISSAPVEFEGKEKPAALALVPEGVLISSDQNLALFDTKGGKVYQKYFPAPKESGLRQALLYASAIRAAYYTAAFGYTSAAFGAASQQIQVQDAQSAAAKDITGRISDVYGEAANAGVAATGDLLARASARFKATQSTAGVQFILSDTGNKEYVLEGVDKSTGAVAGTVPLGRNKTPVYTVDPIENAVYLVEGSAIKAYRLQ